MPGLGYVPQACRVCPGKWRVMGTGMLILKPRYQTKTSDEEGKERQGSTAAKGRTQNPRLSSSSSPLPAMHLEQVA